jgi:hypothetical protein
VTPIKIPTSSTSSICSLNQMHSAVLLALSKSSNPINPSKYNEIRYGPVLRDALHGDGSWRWLVPLTNLRAIKEIVRRKS